MSESEDSEEETEYAYSALKVGNICVSPNWLQKFMLSEDVLSKGQCLVVVKKKKRERKNNNNNKKALKLCTVM